jgi:hypothetical protein
VSNKDRVTFFRNLDFWILLAYTLLFVVFLEMSTFYFITSLFTILLFFLPGYMLIQAFSLFQDTGITEKILVSFGISVVIDIIMTFTLGLIGKREIIILLILLEIWILSLKSMYDHRHSKTIAFIKAIDREKTLASVLLLMCVVFFIGVYIRNVDFIHDPDEYRYIMWAKDLQNDILIAPKVGPDPQARVQYVYEYVTLLTMYGLALIYSFFFDINGVGLYQGQILALFMYVMFVLVTYLLGSELFRNKIIGLIAAIFISTNPMVWLFANRIMRDIPASIFSNMALYFFYRSFREKVKVNYFLLAITFMLFSLMVSPIAVWLLIPCSIYSFSNFNTEKTIIAKLYRSAPLVLFCSLNVINFIVTLIKYPNHPDPPWNMYIEMFSIFHFNLEEWYNYLLSIKVYGTWLSPYFYTHSVALLILLGIFNLLFKQKELKRERIFLLSYLFLYTWWVSTYSAVSFVRHMFPVFTILMTLAAFGSLDSSFLCLLLIPAFVLLLKIPSPSYIPFIQDVPSDFPDAVKVGSMLGGLSIIFFKASEYILSRRITLVGIYLKTRNRVKLFIHFPAGSFAVCVVLISMLTSVYYGNYFVNHGPNENVSAYDTGLIQAVQWINLHAQNGSKIMSNAFFQVPYYLYKIAGDSFTYIEPPWIYDYGTYEKAREIFLNMTISKRYDYLLIFTHKYMSYFWPRYFLYLREFVNSPPPGTIEVYRYFLNGETLFVIYKIV